MHRLLSRPHLELSPLRLRTSPVSRCSLTSSAKRANVQWFEIQFQIHGGSVRTSISESPLSQTALEPLHKTPAVWYFSIDW